MLSSQEEKRDRIETIENDRLVREAEQQRIQLEGSTMYQHAQSAANDEAGGRFASVNPTRVIGATPNIAAAYPAASSAHQTELPPELPTGHDINEMPPLEPSTVHASVEATGPASADAPPLSDLASLSDAQRAGAGPSFSQTETMAARGMSQISASSGEDGAVRLARPPVSTDADNG
jgi:hypothetical protein